jgi:hypothetical protein
MPDPIEDFDLEDKLGDMGKSLVSSVVGGLVQQAVVPPLLGWLGVSTGPDFGSYFTAVHQKLDRLGNGISQIKTQLDQVHVKLDRVEVQLRTGLEDTLEAIADVNLQANLRELLSPTAVIDTRFAKYNSALKYLTVARDQEKGARILFDLFDDDTTGLVVDAMTKIHGLCVGQHALKGIIFYQNNLCDRAAAQKLPKADPFGPLRAYLDNDAIPTFKLVLAAQVKGLIMLIGAWSETRPEELRAPIELILSSNSALKKFFAELVKRNKTKEQANIFNVSQSLFFHRLPANQAELTAIQNQPPGIKIRLKYRGFKADDPYVGIDAEGRAKIYPSATAETNLLWVDKGEGKLAITNEAGTFSLQGRKYSLWQTQAAYHQDRLEGKPIPSHLTFTPAQTIAGPRGNTINLPAGYFPTNLPALTYDMGGRPAVYTPVDLNNMRIALRDAQNKLLYEDGTVFDFDRPYADETFRPGQELSKLKFEQLETVDWEDKVKPHDVHGIPQLTHLNWLFREWRYRYAYLVEFRT